MERDRQGKKRAAQQPGTGGDAARDRQAGEGGVPSRLQPGGTLPGGSPAAGLGSIGTGGGSTAGKASGNVGKAGR